jgi:hypothetical protein
MAADQAPGHAGKAQAVIARLAREVAWPGGKDIDWEKVQGVIAIIGAVTLLHGLRTRSWRYVHTATTVLAISTAAAGYLKDKYAGAPLVTETNDRDLRRSDSILARTARARRRYGRDRRLASIRLELTPARGRTTIMTTGT